MCGHYRYNFQLCFYLIRYVIQYQLIQGGERTPQSRDQNIEIEYKLGNIVSHRTGKIDFFNTLVVLVRKIVSAEYENNFVLVILHAKLFIINL